MRKHNYKNLNSSLSQNEHSKITRLYTIGQLKPNTTTGSNYSLSQNDYSKMARLYTIGHRKPNVCAYTQYSDDGLSNQDTSSLLISNLSEMHLTLVSISLPDFPTWDISTTDKTVTVDNKKISVALDYALKHLLNLEKLKSNPNTQLGIFNDQYFVFSLFFNFFYSRNLGYYLFKSLRLSLDSEAGLNQDIFKSLFLEYQKQFNFYFERNLPVSEYTFGLAGIFFNSLNLKKTVRLLMVTYNKKFWDSLSPSQKFGFCSQVIELTRTSGSYRYINTLFSPLNISCCSQNQDLVLDNSAGQVVSVVLNAEQTIFLARAPRDWLLKASTASWGCVTLFKKLPADQQIFLKRFAALSVLLSVGFGSVLLGRGPGHSLFLNRREQSQTYVVCENPFGNRTLAALSLQQLIFKAAQVTLTAEANTAMKSHFTNQMSAFATGLAIKEQIISAPSSPRDMWLKKPSTAEQFSYDSMPSSSSHNSTPQRILISPVSPFSGKRQSWSQQSLPKTPRFVIKASRTPVAKISNLAVKSLSDTSRQFVTVFVPFQPQSLAKPYTITLHWQKLNGYEVLPFVVNPTMTSDDIKKNIYELSPVGLNTGSSNNKQYTRNVFSDLIFVDSNDNFRPVPSVILNYDEQSSAKKYTADRLHKAIIETRDYYAANKTIQKEQKLFSDKNKAEYGSVFLSLKSTNKSGTGVTSGVLLVNAVDCNAAHIMTNQMCNAAGIDHATCPTNNTHKGLNGTASGYDKKENCTFDYSANYTKPLSEIWTAKLAGLPETLLPTFSSDFKDSRMVEFFLNISHDTYVSGRLFAAETLKNDCLKPYSRELRESLFLKSIINMLVNNHARLLHTTNNLSCFEQLCSKFSNEICKQHLFNPTGALAEGNSVQYENKLSLIVKTIVDQPRSPSYPMRTLASFQKDLDNLYKEAKAVKVSSLARKELCLQSSLLHAVLTAKPLTDVASFSKTCFDHFECSLKLPASSQTHPDKMFLESLKHVGIKTSGFVTNITSKIDNLEMSLCDALDLTNLFLDLPTTSQDAKEALLKLKNEFVLSTTLLQSIKTSVLSPSFGTLNQNYSDVLSSLILSDLLTQVTSFGSQTKKAAPSGAEISSFENQITALLNTPFFLQGNELVNSVTNNGYQTTSIFHSAVDASKFEQFYMKKFVQGTAQYAATKPRLASSPAALAIKDSSSDLVSTRQARSNTAAASFFSPNGPKVSKEQRAIITRRVKSQSRISSGYNSD